MSAQIIGAAVEAELARRIARSEVDAVLTTEKLAIQDEVRAAAQKRLNDYRAGVLLSTINIESVAAPPEAADAFRDVASARADTARIVSEAEGYANDLLPRARGEARQMLEAAEAYRRSASTNPSATPRASPPSPPNTPRLPRSPATACTSRPWSRSCPKSAS